MLHNNHTTTTTTTTITTSTSNVKLQIIDLNYQILIFFISVLKISLI